MAMNVIESHLKFKESLFNLILEQAMVDVEDKGVKPATKSWDMAVNSKFWEILNG